MKLSQTTCSIKKIQAAFEKLFIEKIKIGYGIMQIGISLTDLTYEPDMQLSFFDDPEDDEKEKNIEVAMIDIPYTLYMVYTTMLILTYAEYFLVCQ